MKSKIHKRNSVRGKKSQGSSDQIAWHYTTGVNFIKIVESGFLLPTDACINLGELPVLWFSLNQHWEPTSRKAMITEDGRFRSLTKFDTRR